MTFKKSLSVLLVFIFAISGLLVPGNTTIDAAADYVQVTREVTPAEITTEQEATVNLNILGTPPESVVKPNDVILIIDKSGSMLGENKINAAKDSAKSFIDLMDLSVHRIGIVDFSARNNIGVLPLTSDATAAKAYVDTIVANGGTATGDAIGAAIAELTRAPIEGVQPVIVIMTDGDATQAPTGSSNAYAYALQKANEAKDAGIVFYTIALLLRNDNPDTSGPNNLLKQMATTNSHHHFVLGSVGLSDIYKAIVKEIGIASAYDVVVTDTVSDKFEIVPGSYADNIPQPTVVGNTFTWSFKELKNNALTFTYKIRPVSQTATGTFSVATTTSNISYKDYAGSQRSKVIPNGTVKVKLPAPVITSVTEPKGHPTGGNEVLISGDKFVQGAKVYFGAKEATAVTYIDKNTLKVIAPFGNQGEVEIKVVNPDSQYATSKYQYIANPEVSSYSPTEGSLEGNTIVTFNGNYFMNGIEVKFGDNTATIVTQRVKYLSVKTPSATEAGAVDIVLTNKDGSTLTIADGYKYVAPEVPKLEISSLTPAKGLASGGETVYIYGKNIDNGVKVYFGANEALLNKYTSNNTIQVTAPAGVLGEVDVKLVNPDGQEAVLSKGYKYVNPEYPAPVITDISPNISETTGGIVSYITGNNFVNGLQFYINNVQAEVTNVSANRLTIKVPASTVIGTFDVKVVNPDNKESVLPVSFTYVEPAPLPTPTINTIAPASGLITGNQAVTLTGTNFVNGAIVYLDNVPTTTTFNSSKQLKFVTPTWSGPAGVSVKVENPDGQQSLEPVSFTYTEPQPEPVSITMLDPNSGLTLGGEYVYISGSNFKSGIKVFFGGVEAEVKSVSKTRLSVIAPAASQPQQVDVTVLNTDKGTYTAPDAYTYTLTKPKITSITPESGGIAGGTTVVINGTNFDKNMTVTLNGAIIPIDSFNSNKRVQIITPATSSAGEVPLVITLPNGESASTVFTYVAPPMAPAPVVRLLDASSGPEKGGNTIYLSGSNFVKGAQVFFNGIESSKVTYSSKVRLSVVVPAGTGVVEVWVVNPDGQSSNRMTYTYK